MLTIKYLKVVYVNKSEAELLKKVCDLKRKNIGFRITYVVIKGALPKEMVITLFVGCA